MSKNCVTCFGTLAALALLIVFAAPASAGPLTINVTGWGPQSFPFNQGYPGDTVQFLPFSIDNLNLTPGVATIAKINTLLWTVNYSGGQGQPSDADFNFTASRTMTIYSDTGAVIQNGLLLVRYYYDTLSINSGSTVIFDFGSYKINVTPLAAGPWTQGNLGTYSYDIQAEFLLYPVPEPSLILLLGLGLGAVSLVTWRFRA